MQKIRIAIDAMGGDYAPQEIVKGAVEAARADREIVPILVGPLDRIEEELGKYDVSGLDIPCVHSDDFIKEEVNPAIVVRQRPNSSISVANRLVKSGEADALIGATPTGSLVACAIQHLGMLDGIERPVFGGVISGLSPNTIMLDLGVNIDCRPEHLVNFAVIGTVYARTLLDIPDPKVALLNIGKESIKGSKTIRTAYDLLQKSRLSFVGNIEGDEVLSGKVNVIVCDGFIGNTVLKYSESVDGIISSQVDNLLLENPVIESVVPRSKLKDSIGLSFLPGVIGGGILWGVNGIVAKTHGNSLGNLVAKRLYHVKFAVKRNIIGCLKTELSRVRDNIKLQEKD